MARFNEVRKITKAQQEMYVAVNSMRTDLKETALKHFKKSFYDAGQFYLGTRYSWTNNSKIIKGIILPKYSSIDIDDNEDWLFSKSLYKLFKNEKKL